MRSSAFVSSGVVAQSWYVAAHSRDVRRGRVTAADVCGRRVALYRDGANAVRAVEGYCPHLGADLSLGRVVDGEIECAFHGWRFDAAGACTRAPGCARLPRRATSTLPVEERWGLVWIFTGPTPLFALPESAFGAQARLVRLPRQRIACHPHLVIANGLDATHYGTLHDLDLTSEPALRFVGDYALELTLRGRVRNRLPRTLTGAGRAGFAATFTTYGCSVAVARITSPIALEVIFTGMLDAGGACATQTIVVLPSWQPLRVMRAAALLVMLLAADRRILETIRFREHFAESDAPLKAFRDVVNRLPVW